MGNSEVGHMNLGAGRVVYQNLTRIDKDIEEGAFESNAVLIAAVDKTIQSKKALHIFGLMSPGGIHSHEDQIMAMIDLAITRGAGEIYLHAFLDGRDTPPRSALPSLLRAEQRLLDSGKGRVASLCGRFFAMDRDNRWDRVKPAYELLTEAKADYHFDNVTTAIEAAYAREEDDEFVQASLVGEKSDSSAALKDNDVVVFMNFRSDRAREITRAITDAQFDGFERTVRPNLAEFVTLTQYAADINTPCAYKPQELNNVLGLSLIHI